jgi:hypothetical protein
MTKKKDAGRDFGTPKRYAHGSDQIAQACAAAIYGEDWDVTECHVNYVGAEVRTVIARERVVERIAATLESINASPHEPGRRSSVPSDERLHHGARTKDSHYKERAK